MDFDIDDALLNEAQQLSGQSTYDATVNLALRELIQRRLQRKAIEIFGTCDWDSSYDYKRERRR
jgi:hypothetical protein